MTEDESNELAELAERVSRPRTEQAYAAPLPLGSPEERAAAAEELLSTIGDVGSGEISNDEPAPVSANLGHGEHAQEVADAIRWPRPMGDFDELCFVLGGSSDSWTGLALVLIAKSDREHLASLRKGIPMHVAAWEAWMSGPTAAEGIELARSVVSAFHRQRPEVM